MSITYELTDPSEIPSPALIYYADGIRENIERAIKIADGPERLWPHVKTHKLAEVVRMLQDAGIRRFKCATIAEAEMLAMCGAGEVLLAYQPVGPAVDRFLRLMREFPKTGWWTIGDSDIAFAVLDEKSRSAGLRPNVLIDVNMGMNRTGVSLDTLEEFYKTQAARKGLRVRGLHCYDGHLRNPNPELRKQETLPAAESALAIRDSLLASGMECDTIIMGGTPTFPCHAGRTDVFLSPGTLFIGDYGCKSAFADLDFEPAAAILTRVVSRPADDLFTLDLGHKAIGADPPGQRGIIVSLPGAIPVAQSEEHWVFRFDKDRPEMPCVGDVLYVIPTHICPTTALYSEVLVAREGRIDDVWQVKARDRRITV